MVLCRERRRLRQEPFAAAARRHNRAMRLRVPAERQPAKERPLAKAHQPATRRRAVVAAAQRRRPSRHT